MTTKPKEHDINRKGKAMFRDAVESIGWVVNEVQEDYGIDFNVQVFHEGVASGGWFHVQLKSSESSRYSRDGKFVSQRLSTRHALHYTRDLGQPVFIVHADVLSGRVYWYAPQLDPQGTINAQKNSVTIQIPTNQTLPETGPQLLDSIEQIHLVLANRAITSSSNSSFAGSLKYSPDEDELQRAFQEKNDLLKLRKIASFYRIRKYEDARPRAESVSRDPDASLYAKVWALAQLGWINSASAFRSDRPQEQMGQESLLAAREMRTVTRTAPRNLKFFSLIMNKSAELQVIIHEYFTCIQAERSVLNTKLTLDIRLRKGRLEKQIVAKYNQCIRLINLANRIPDRMFLPHSFVTVVLAISGYALALRVENKIAAATKLSASALQICKLSESIDKQIGDDEGRAFAIVSAAILTESANAEAFSWALQTAQEMPESDHRTGVLAMLGRAKRRWAGENLEMDHKGDIERQIVQNIATALKLKITDGLTTDEIALKISAAEFEVEI